jgi:hypothetical protein
MPAHKATLQTLRLQKHLPILVVTETQVARFLRCCFAALQNGCTQYESGIQSFRMSDHQQGRRQDDGQRRSGAVRT